MAISKKKQLEDLTARLLNLDPNIIIKKSELTPSGELIYLEVPLPKIRVCTECGSNNCNIKAREEHTFNFHLIQRLDKTVDAVRIRMQNYYNDKGDNESYQLLKHISYILKTKTSNQLIKWGKLTTEKRRKLENAFTVAPELKTVYFALQDFHEILDEPCFQIQKDLLTEWFEKYRHTDIKELKTPVKVFYSYRSYILNAWRYGRSNGPCEGLNNKIKDVKRTMFGAHSFENFRKRILLTCGGLSLASDNLIFHISGKE